ncbi:MAG: hypothetical protein Q8L48_20710 [Archangium sp.]|nr:hypothetical protein [Archangium sp.]
MTKTLAVIACLTSSLAVAQTVPGSITFNARLSDTGGAPITGSHALGFGLYDSGSGGAALWTENVSGASFSTEGVAFVELGAVTPLTTTVLDGRKLYLEVSVDGTTMSPRLAIVSVPYAIRASVAASALQVGSLTESAIQRRVTGTCNAGQAVRSIDAAGGVQCESVSGGGGGDITSVTTAAGSGLNGGAATGDVPLSLITCAAGEVLKHNGTAWACAADASGSTMAGPGLTLAGSTLSINFGGGGSATTVARSDHKHGAMYTRWGVSTCPAGVTRVYGGYTAGALHSHAGGGANTVCLAAAPVYTTPTGSLMTFNDNNLDHALIYGGEYETNGGQIGLDSRHDYDSVCAVCLQPNASNVFMYPGAATCPSGWNTEYYGYLMSSHYTQPKTDWLCVDVNPTAAGSVGNSNGRLLYSTEAECGALPCGGTAYTQNREIVCSVCSQ